MFTYSIRDQSWWNEFATENEIRTYLIGVFKAYHLIQIKQNRSKIKMQNQENLRENLLDEDDFIPRLEPRELFYVDKHLIE